MSVFCPHCRKRVVIEDYKIDAYHAARKVHTTGDVTVGKKGTLSGEIKASNLTVKGNAWGTMDIRGKMQITKTGSLRGDVRAPRLVVEPGATIQGHFEIGPQQLRIPPAHITPPENPTLKRKPKPTVKTTKVVKETTTRLPRPD